MASIIEQIKLDAQNYKPGILPPGKNSESLIGHTVINISDTTLTEAQTSALEKGLTFCPTPGPPNKGQIWNDFKDFHRRLVLKHHFYNDNNLLDKEDRELVNILNDNLMAEIDPHHNIHKNFKPKSNWKPANTHVSLNAFKHAFKKQLLHSKNHKRPKDNLTKDERTGLKSLQDNKNIVIQKADKGSAVVVMNTTDYLREGYRQLSYPKFYTKIENDPTKQVSEKITEVLTKMKQRNFISDKNFEFLNPTGTREGKFYLLPKIHKKGIPGRPICSSINHPTANISKFVDAHIKEYVPKTASYIKDTQNFIKKITELGPLPEGSILATLDVTSLYTNIPNQGLVAVADKLRKDPNKTGISQYILDLLKLVLHNMYFEFNGEHYLQIGGTAMGTALAPNYANLFMGKFETKALANYHLKPLIWKRFIDDIFIVWTHGQNELNKFVEYLNGLHTTIKFTSECSTKEVSFLDTTVSFDENNKLITALYNKPTDTHLYLHHTSAHPNSVMTKGPYGQFLRLRRICSKEEEYQENSRKLIEFYQKQGYPTTPLIKHKERAQKFTQLELLQPKTKTQNEKPVMVTTYKSGNSYTRIGILLRTLKNSTQYFQKNP